ncbi:hypothetical protein STCU_11410 [Strigomonas culicis]|uniref:Uncharacterized protein n=1 Tax=Strigomonas culicis TaxID=28005 RepID=S9TIV4_9TRYP|nr:hypothetical protein STCU_11410 [Strigomonas culicis]|eukprot:EPY16303.1 hypothetical protein STCU_11410 [Strigomonas culicis]
MLSITASTRGTMTSSVHVTGKKTGSVQVKDEKDEKPEVLIQRNLSMFRKKLLKDLKDNESFNANNSNSNNTSGHAVDGGKKGDSKVKVFPLGTKVGSRDVQESVRMVLAGRHKSASRGASHSQSRLLESAQSKENHSYLERMYVAPMDTGTLALEKRIQQSASPSTEMKAGSRRRGN